MKGLLVEFFLRGQPAETWRGLTSSGSGLRTFHPRALVGSLKETQRLQERLISRVYPLWVFRMDEGL